MPFEAFASSSMSRRRVAVVRWVSAALWAPVSWFYGWLQSRRGRSIRPGTNNEVVQRGWSCLCHSWLAVGGVFKLVPHSAWSLFAKVRNFDRSGEDTSLQSWRKMRPTDVVYSTGDFMRQCKNVCKTRSLIYAWGIPWSLSYLLGLWGEAQRQGSHDASCIY